MNVTLLCLCLGLALWVVGTLLPPSGSLVLRILAAVSLGVATVAAAGVLA